MLKTYRQPDRSPLVIKQGAITQKWVRNRVIEIQRLTNVEDWRYIDSKQMMADLGTRKGVALSDVQEESEWFIGQEWMR